MALFKILKGQQARLPNTSKQGYAYYTTDKGKFYIFNSATQRRTLNPDIKITIGNQTKTSTTLSPEVAFDLASIGAAAAGHNHDDRYLKLSGGTMTGDIIFTNKDANRLIWTDKDKKVSTTGHYATSDRVAINSTSEPGYNFYVNGTSYFVNNVGIAGTDTSYKLYVNGKSYFTGTIRAKTAGSSWIDGQKGTDRSALLVTDATDSVLYWPWISHHNISSKRYFSLGQSANSIYLIGTTDTRTTDGYDYGWQFDFSNGVMTVPGNIQPVSTNTQTLGTSSLRWAKVYIGTADTYGSTTKGIYWNAGVPTAMTYELKSTVNDGTATRIAYYSGTNAVSSGSIVTDGSYLRNIGGYNNSSYSLSAESAIINNYLNIAGSSSSTRYKLYVVGQSWISGTLWNQHLYPQATKTYDLGSTGYIWNNIYGNQLWLYNLQEGNLDITDNTEILTSYASDNGFADSNAVGKVYKRDAIHLYNYIISKTDNFYVKKAGDTMTGNLSFSSIGDVATSSKISWSGSTDGADIYYQTTGADQGNLVLNTRDDANCYIRFAYNGAFKSYIRTSDGTYIGKLLGISESSTWIDGQRYERGGFNLSNATNTANYWPWLRQTNTSSARWFSFGTLGNCFYMIGSSTGRTDNGYDHGLCYDISNGNLSGINDIYGNAQHLLINGVTWSSNWNWSGQGGQPAWLWGSNDGSNMYVWKPSNFDVNSADHLRGTHGHSIKWGWTGHKLQAYVDNIIVCDWNPTWPSDRRLKKNIKDISDRYLKAIGKIKLVQFNYNQKSYIFNDNLLHFGAIAQDIMNSLHQQGLNEFNSNLILKTQINKNQYYEIDYTSFLILRIAYDQQKSNKQIQQLKQQILKLKSQIQLLNAKLDTLVVSHL